MTSRYSLPKFGELMRSATFTSVVDLISFLFLKSEYLDYDARFLSISLVLANMSDRISNRDGYRVLSFIS